jgi:hypothetical protein
MALVSVWVAAMAAIRATMTSTAAARQGRLRVQAARSAARRRRYSAWAEAPGRPTLARTRNATTGSPAAGHCRPGLGSRRSFGAVVVEAAEQGLEVGVAEGPDGHPWLLRLPGGPAVVGVRRGGARAWLASLCC